jgi:hypothetical protein
MDPAVHRYAQDVRSFDWFSIQQKIISRREWAIVYDGERSAWEVWADGRKVDDCADADEAEQSMARFLAAHAAAATEFHADGMPAAGEVMAVSSEPAGPVAMVGWSPLRDPGREVVQLRWRQRLARQRAALLYVAAVVVVAAGLLLGLYAAGVVPLPSPVATRPAEGQHKPDGPGAATRADTTRIVEVVRGLGHVVGGSSTYQVKINLKDAASIPDVLFGDAVLVATGTVDAFAEFGRLPADAVRPGQDGSTVIMLPDIQLTAPRLDMSGCYISSINSGIENRVADVVVNPDDQKRLFDLAAAQITATAKASDLTEHAEQAIRLTVQRALQTAGITAVTVISPTASHSPPA